MSLSPAERAALGEIESRLLRSDPRLAAMLTYWTTGRVRAWLGRVPLPGRRGPGELTRRIVVTAGLAVVIGLAVASILTAHPARSTWRGQNPGPEVVTPASARPYGAYPQAGHPARARSPRPYGTGRG